MHEGLESVRLGLRGIPRSSEDVMVARDIILAEVTGVRYHVAHISSQHSVAMVAHAQASRLAGNGREPRRTTSCSQTSDMRPYDSSFKMKPPLRESPDVQAVTEGLVNGSIEAIATDHAPHPGDEKMQEFERCPFGIIGLETAIPLALEQLWHSKRMILSNIVKLFTSGPAEILSSQRPRDAAPGVACRCHRFWVKP